MSVQYSSVGEVAKGARVYGFLLDQHLRLMIQLKPALRINPLLEKSMNPGAIKIG
jgi:hypothetical protein